MNHYILAPFLINDEDISSYQSLKVLHHEIIEWPKNQYFENLQKLDVSINEYYQVLYLTIIKDTNPKVGFLCNNNLILSGNQNILELVNNFLDKPLLYTMKRILII
jgi:hypothetical protein